MKPRSRRTGGRKASAVPNETDRTRGSSAGHYLSVPSRASIDDPWQYPRAACPACHSQITLHLLPGLFTEFPRDLAPWVCLIGCCDYGYDRYCETCNYLWSCDGRATPMYASDPGSPHSELVGRTDRLAEFRETRRREMSPSDDSDQVPQ